MESNGQRHPPRRSAQSTAGKYLSEPTGPLDGRKGLGNDTLRRRLHHLVSKPRTSSTGSARCAAMGGASRAEPAPDQNAHCQCQPSWGFRLSRLPLRTRHEMATGEEPGKVQGSHPAENKEDATWVD